MAWEWSHTDKAYEAARNNLAGLSLKTLYEIYGEWKVKDHRASLEDDDDGTEGWDDPVYRRAFAEAKSLPTDVLVDYIWNRAEEQCTRNNGGWHAWLCPHGCGCHMVSFRAEPRLLRTAQKRGLCD